jgi:hypothetical protein
MSRTMTTSARPAASPPDLSPGDRLAERLLAGPLTVLVGCVCLMQLVTWVPHYLTWPLWADHDAFASLARGWEAGLLPYRDLYCNQFPGAIYLFWILGRVAGWGGSASIYAFDAGAVIVLGLGMLAWSRRLGGTILPGLIGYLCFLSYYLTLDYSLAAQRDWHAPFFAVMGLLILQTYPGRVVAPSTSAAMTAMAILIRPHAILFLPAMALQLVGEMREGSGSRRPAVWASAFLATTLLGFAPLLVSGIMPDFLAGVARNNNTWTQGGGGGRAVAILAGLFGQFDTFAYLVVPMAIFLVPRSDRRQRLAAAVWVSAFLLVLLYRPIHPRNHDYLKIPLAVVFAVNVGVLTQWLLSARRVPASFRLLSVLLLLGLGCRTRPEFCKLRPSLWAAADTMRGKAPESSQMPPGYRHGTVLTSAFYAWSDYRATLDYLQNLPSKDTRVANALKGDPAVVGILGRLSAFPTEGISWLWMANPGHEDRFAKALEGEPDSVVVWSPGETGPDPAFKIELIESAIRRLYEPEARFGSIEVWRRKSPESTSGRMRHDQAARPAPGSSVRG